MCWLRSHSFALTTLLFSNNNVLDLLCVKSTPNAMHHPCTDAMHGPACPSSQTPNPAQLNLGSYNYMILLPLTVICTRRQSLLCFLRSPKFEKHKMFDKNIGSRIFTTKSSGGGIVPPFYNKVLLQCCL